MADRNEPLALVKTRRDAAVSAIVAAAVVPALGATLGAGLVAPLAAAVSPPFVAVLAAVVAAFALLVAAVVGVAVALLAVLEAAGLLTAELGLALGLLALRLAQHPGIVFGVLKEALLGNPVVRQLGIARQRQVFFNDMKVPVENLLGERNNGFKIALNALNAPSAMNASGGLSCCKQGFS